MKKNLHHHPKAHRASPPVPPYRRGHHRGEVHATVVLVPRCVDGAQAHPGALLSILHSIVFPPAAQRGLFRPPPYPRMEGVQEVVD